MASTVHLHLHRSGMDAVEELESRCSSTGSEWRRMQGLAGEMVDSVGNGAKLRYRLTFLPFPQQQQQQQEEEQEQGGGRSSRTVSKPPNVKERRATGAQLVVAQAPKKKKKRHHRVVFAPSGSGRDANLALQSWHEWSYGWLSAHLLIISADLQPRERASHEIGGEVRGRLFSVSFSLSHCDDGFFFFLAVFISLLGGVVGPRSLFWPCVRCRWD